MSVSARQLEGERRNAERDRKRVERSPYVLLGVLLALVLGVGVTAAGVALVVTPVRSPAAAPDA